MEYLIIFLLISFNIYILREVIIGNILAFDPRTIFSLTVITQMFPQLAVLYVNPFYQHTQKIIILFLMLLSQIFFNLGYSTHAFKENSSSINVKVIDINMYNMYRIGAIFIFIGLIPFAYYNKIDSVYGGINVILGIFRTLGMLGYILILIYFYKYRKNNRRILMCLIFIGAIELFYFGLFVKGSREILFAFTYISTFFFILFKPRYKKIISRSFLFIFIMSSFLADGSMTDIRRTNNYKDDPNSVDLFKINYIDNFKQSIFNRDISNGMDLGNAAITTNYVYNNNLYNYGASLWNGFIYNFYPSRIFGEESKNNLKISENSYLTNMEENLHNGITTGTGFYAVFKMFSFLGVLIFYGIGYMLAQLYKYSNFSKIYLCLYLFFVTILPNTLTHDIQYMLFRIELIIIIIPFIWTVLVKRNFIFKKNTSNN